MQNGGITEDFLAGDAAFLAGILYTRTGTAAKTETGTETETEDTLRCRAPRSGSPHTYAYTSKQKPCSHKRPTYMHSATFCPSQCTRPACPASTATLCKRRGLPALCTTEREGDGCCCVRIRATPQNERSGNCNHSPQRSLRRPVRHTGGNRGSAPPPPPPAYLFLFRDCFESLNSRGIHLGRNGCTSKTVFIIIEPFLLLSVDSSLGKPNKKQG